MPDNSFRRSLRPSLPQRLARWQAERDPARRRCGRAKRWFLHGNYGDPYQSAQEHWARYCAAAGVDATLHQLRHTHATELVNAGVSLATIRKRLGHRNLQTTLRYAEQSDTAADAEMRAWRRRTDQRPRATRRTQGD
jgi:integrase